jgi:hypothetical protein
MTTNSLELLTARRELQNVTDDLGDVSKLFHFKTAVCSLQKVMLGGSARIDKDLAKKLALSCWNKAVSQTKLILTNFDYHESEYLKHWVEVIELFVDSALDDDPELNALKEQFLARRDLQSIKRLSPVDLDNIEHELRAALDTLSTHRGRLSKIKLSIRK